jgi:ubiquinone/menaquinone biosynthesis C-methylase UbiE
MDELNRRRQAFLARTQQYLSLGFDRFAAARGLSSTMVPVSGPALDVGTGKGVLAMELARLGLDVVSADVNEEDQELAALNASAEGLSDRIWFLLSDAASLPFYDGHFGCAAMVDVLHHLERGEGVLEEMVRLLMPGGKMLVADFSPEGFDLVARVHQSEGGSHPVGPVTLAHAEAFLTGKGLRILHRPRLHLHEGLVLERP